ncbi:MAG: BREX-1 system adenine-specific DNA-methyltransferase PglX [Treponema sp.]
MDKTVIRNFAIEARRSLIQMARDNAAKVGITASVVGKPASEGSDFEIYRTPTGGETTLTGTALRQRKNLVRRIGEKGYDAVMEEAAYTWFNRIIAIRFMELNDYLPSRVRVLSSKTSGKYEPDIVALAPDNVDLNFTESEKETICGFKRAQKLDEAFQYLFIKQCNELSSLLPALFESTTNTELDFTELLLSLSFTRADGVVRRLLAISEDNFRDAVEIIGWLYQYYNTELKDDTFAKLKKNIKISRERIPAATQLFTPDWIVRYMVENSLGRLWTDGHQETPIKANWKYYLEEAEQEPAVKKQLETIRAEYRNLRPEEIKVIDPCMGSGHILVYAFEVLMQIYTSVGWSERDAARAILENNLYGLDIDDRAYQLSYFALMMKGRKYDRRFFEKKVTPHVYAVQESNTLGPADWLSDKEARSTLEYLKNAFTDAKEYGSILNIESRDYRSLLTALDTWEHTHEATLENDAIASELPLIRQLAGQAQVMSAKYDVVVTNPPYMGSNKMNAKLSSFVKKEYPDSKSDLFAVFIEKCGTFTKEKGYTAMITQQSWMFLSSFEQLRAKLVEQRTIVNMAHLGARAFDDIGGEIVQPTAFVLLNTKIKDCKGTYIRLLDFKGENEKKKAFIFKKNIYSAKQESFSKILGIPIAYWIKDNKLEIFSNTVLGEIGETRRGLQTGNSAFFIRFWYELNKNELSLPREYSKKSNWVIMNNGGNSRKWYGEILNSVLWKNKGEKIKKTGKAIIPSENLYFRKCITWNRINNGDISVKLQEQGIIQGDMSPFFILNSDKYFTYLFGLLNSKISSYLIHIINPTITMPVGDIAKIPVKFNELQKPRIDCLVQQNISLSKLDWDAFETSWDFVRHPLLPEPGSVDYKDTVSHAFRIADYFDSWQTECDRRFSTLKANEEELNRIFIDIYGLKDELTSDVVDKDVTVRRADRERDIKSFVSYAVGCMFGRYSLSFDGLAYAGGNMDLNRYTYFIPDADNIIPISDDEYFPDDIVTRFAEFVKTVYGSATLEENLSFIADALGSKGATPRDAIRTYFLKDFYRDHLKIYQKRPIYWLFDSGKENGFKALIYIHRYDNQTLARMRTEYAFKQQKFLENALERCNQFMDNPAVTAQEKAAALKKQAKLARQIAEVHIYEQALHHLADEYIDIDLDDGVNVNYEKFQGVEVAHEGEKTLAVNLLATRG